VEDVLYDDDAPVVGSLCFLFFGYWRLVHSAAVLLFLAGGEQFRYSDTYSELFMTIRTLEDECLSGVVACFVESDVLIAFGTAYSFHSAKTQVEAYSVLVRWSLAFIL
jgi:hypothetical protein